jgi:ClpP class serine protease
MPRKPAVRALQLMTSRHWAITRPALERMVAVASRSLEDPAYFASILGMEDDDDEEAAPLVEKTPRWALLSRPATPHPASARVGVSDGVAILSVTGPLCRYASWFQDVCGMSSYQLLAEDFRIALEDPAIKAILMHFDSPGGETNGCAELAALVHAHRGAKPIVAMVSDAAASAAYWIAAACDEIVVSPSAYVGSIGVYWEIVDYSEMDAQNGIKVWRIVSTQSPNKVPDPGNAAGKAVLQGEVDQFADAFLAAAADYRGTTPEELIAAGNGGGICIGRHAVEAGLADRVATTEDVLAELAAGPSIPAATDGGALASRPAALTEHSIMPKPNTPVAAAPGPRAYAEGDEVRSLVARDVSIAEGATGKVAEVREGVTVVAITLEGGDARWLIADEEVELTAAKPAEAAPAETTEEPAPAATGAVTTLAQLAAAYPQLIGQARLQGAKGERARISALVALDERQSTPALRAAIASGQTPGQAAKALLVASRETGQSALAAIVATEAAPAPANGPAAATDGPDVVASIGRLMDQNDPARRRAQRAAKN